MQHNHYAILGLDSTANTTTIKQAYRQLAAKYHPDRHIEADALVMSEKFRMVQMAYDVLSDDTSRQNYDKNRQRSLLSNPLQTASEIWSQRFQVLMDETA